MTWNGETERTYLHEVVLDDVADDTVSEEAVPTEETGGRKDW